MSDKLKIAKKALLKLGIYDTAAKLYRYLLQPGYSKKIKFEEEFYGSLIKPGDLCFDIGANLGRKAEVFLNLGTKVVALEPQPYCIDVLNARFKENRNFICVPKGVGDKEGSLTLHIHEENIGASSFLPHWQQETAQIKERIVVNMTTLDILIAEYGYPDFCKVDVEGFELSVLKGLSSPISTLCFEYHLDREDKEIQKTLACLNYLSGLTDFVLQINVIPGSGKPEFISQDWWNLDKFVDFFKHELSKNAKFAYGDIFVRMK